MHHTTEQPAVTHTPRPFQFSVTKLLVFMTLCSAALAYWKHFIYVTPTHGLLEYEQAPAVRDSIQLGDHEIRLELVARNDSDGSIRVEDGRGTTLSAEAKSPHRLSQSATWLDVAQLEIAPTPTPHLLDIKKVRVMEHGTRLLLSEFSPRLGWRLADRNVVQIYGLGKSLPNIVDVWLSVRIYDKNDTVAKLAPQIGATGPAPAALFSIVDLRSGSWTWSEGNELTSYNGNDDATTAVLQWNSTSLLKNYEITAVPKSDGELFASEVHSIYPQPFDTRLPIQFNIPLDRIDHFALRPCGTDHSFFFDGVQLPKRRSKQFASAPTALVDVGGKNLHAVVPEFSPLKFIVKVRPTEPKLQFLYNDLSGVTISPQPQNTAVGMETTVSYQMEGISYSDVEFSFHKPAHPNHVDSTYRQIESGIQSQVGVREVPIPPSMLQQFNVTIRPKP